MRYFLSYGTGRLSVEIPKRHVVKVFEIRPTPPLSDPLKEIRDKLKHPTASKSLAEIASGKKSACVVVSDATRPVPNRTILPPILETLEQAGVDRSNILLLVATGLHKPSTTEEKLEMLGPEILNDYRVEDHDARKREEHDFLGETASGIPVWIDRRYLEADVKLLTGLIEPHFMAGFSGGRKSICPGIAARETISAWHSPRLIEQENARLGRIDDNPVHVEQLDIAAKAGCDFMVNAIIDPDRRILSVVAGNLVSAHREGVRFARRVVTDTISEPVDLVVAGSGGSPLDKTFYQSVKGIVAAIDILKPGGTVILASACDGGLGSSEFEQIARKFSSIGDFLREIRAGRFFIENQWQMEELAKALNKGRVRVVTQGLSPEELRNYFVEPLESVERGVAEAIDRYGPGTTIALMPDGPHVLAELTPQAPSNRLPTE